MHGTSAHSIGTLSSVRKWKPGASIHSGCPKVWVQQGPNMVPQWCSTLFSTVITKHIDQKLENDRICVAYTSRSQSLTDGGQNRKQKAETKEDAAW